MILAIDTSIGSGVALVDAETGEVRASAESDAPRGHAEVIGTLIESALREAGASPADVSYVASGMGPGPFTGLRIGIAAARAFAVGRGIPVIPVASHDAAALEILDEDPGAAVAVVTDARRREYAVSAYDGLADGIPRRFAGPELIPQTEDPDAWFAQQLERSAARSVHPAAISAGRVGKLAARLVRAGRVSDLDPLYLRAPDAKVPGAVKRVST